MAANDIADQDRDLIGIWELVIGHLIRRIHNRFRELSGSKECRVRACPAPTIRLSACRRFLSPLGDRPTYTLKMEGAERRVGLPLAGLNDPGSPAG